MLLAKGRPFAAERITLRLFDIPGGSRIEMAEVPIGGHSTGRPAALRSPRYVRGTANVHNASSPWQNGAQSPNELR